MKAEELLAGLPVRFEDAAAGEEGHAEDHHEQHGADREASAGRARTPLVSCMNMAAGNSTRPTTCRSLPKDCIALSCSRCEYCNADPGVA